VKRLGVRAGQQFPRPGNSRKESNDSRSTSGVKRKKELQDFPQSFSGEVLVQPTICPVPARSTDHSKLSHDQNLVNSCSRVPQAAQKEGSGAGKPLPSQKPNSEFAMTVSCYFSSTPAPCSSSSFLSFSASSLLRFSLTVFGAPSTRSLA